MGHDTYAMHLGQATTAVVTGKPIELGVGRRREATGRGVMICCDKALAKPALKTGCRVVIAIRKRRLAGGGLDAEGRATKLSASRILAADFTTKMVLIFPSD